MLIQSRKEEKNTVLRQLLHTTTGWYRLIQGRPNHRKAVTIALEPKVKTTSH